MEKVALFTIVVGKDPIYFNSVRRYFPYNREYFGQNQNVNYFLFTDREETIEGFVNICSTNLLTLYSIYKKNENFI
jgi:hypothetical protein